MLLQGGGWEQTSKYSEITDNLIYKNNDIILIYNKEDIYYILWNSIEQFENAALPERSHLLLFGELPASFDDIIENRIAVLREKADSLNIHLDGSIKSFQLIDEHFDSLFYSDRKIIPRLFFPLVFYTGHVIAKAVGGKWSCVKNRNFNEPWLILSDDKHINISYIIYDIFISKNDDDLSIEREVLRVCREVNAPRPGGSELR